nr:protein FAR-RED IMPAIRED RESPONSE 1 isoform X1 [Ipomoea batatas]
MKLVRSASAKLRLSHATSRTAAKPTLPVTATATDVRKLMARLEMEVWKLSARLEVTGDGNCRAFTDGDDLNKDQWLRNAFWIHAKDWLDYHRFCDAVFFDTAYINNEYKLPSVTVIGVNHRFQLLH